MACNTFMSEEPWRSQIRDQWFYNSAIKSATYEEDEEFEDIIIDLDKIDASAHDMSPVILDGPVFSDDYYDDDDPWNFDIEIE